MMIKFNICITIFIYYNPLNKFVKKLLSGDDGCDCTIGTFKSIEPIAKGILFL